VFLINLRATWNLAIHYLLAIGRPVKLREVGRQAGQRFLKGITPANALFPVGAG